MGLSYGLLMSVMTDRTIPFAWAWEIVFERRPLDHRNRGSGWRSEGSDAIQFGSTTSLREPSIISEKVDPGKKGPERSRYEFSMKHFSLANYRAFVERNSSISHSIRHQKTSKRLESSQVTCSDSCHTHLHFLEECPTVRHAEAWQSPSLQFYSPYQLSKETATSLNLMLTLAISHVTHRCLLRVVEIPWLSQCNFELKICF
jgi:hypothetical protein